MSNQSRYRAVLKRIRRERGEYCETCGMPAYYGHHITSVSDTGIAAELVFHPANIMLLCDDCHALMHPGARNRNMVRDWLTIRRDRSQAIHRS